MSKLKVLLVYPNLQMVMLLPNNVAMLSACLKRCGIDVRLFDTTLYRTADRSVDDIRVEHMQLRPFNLKEKGVDYKAADVFESFRKAVNEYKPDVIAVSATDDTFDLGIKLVSGVRKTSRAHVIFGGAYPTFSPEDAISSEGIDSICIGEGEGALADLCRHLQSDGDITSIENLWVKADGRIYKNRPRAPVDINDMPFEDFTIFEESRFFRPMQGKIHRMVPVSMDRGCPFSCTFCAAPIYRDFYSRSTGCNYFRLKTIDRIIEELKNSVEKYGAGYIYFNSETFFARKDSEMEEFAARYRSEVKLPFWCQTRVETITEKRVKMLEDIGCDRISIGLEHGNEDFRRKILKKHFGNSQVIDAFGILAKSRIPVTVNNIIGFPDETRELVFDTIKLNRQIHADSINAYFFVPYSGTPLRSYCLDKGYLSRDTKTDSLMRSSVLNMPAFPAEEIKGLVRTFPLYVKMPESYFDRIREAERLDAEGDRVLAELRDIYFKKYFK